MMFAKHHLFNSIQTPSGTKPTVRRLYGLFLCPHDEITNYVRIDHEAGPGCFADNYEGECCMQCGLIFHEIKVY